jgi:hypothetical protein
VAAPIEYRYRHVVLLCQHVFRGERVDVPIGEAANGSEQQMTFWTALQDKDSTVPLAPGVFVLVDEDGGGRSGEIICLFGGCKKHLVGDYHAIIQTKDGLARFPLPTKGASGRAAKRRFAFPLQVQLKVRVREHGFELGASFSTDNPLFEEVKQLIHRELLHDKQAFSSPAKQSATKLSPRPRACDGSCPAVASLKATIADQQTSITALQKTANQRLKKEKTAQDQAAQEATKMVALRKQVSDLQQKLADQAVQFADVLAQQQKTNGQPPSGPGAGSGGDVRLQDLSLFLKDREKHAEVMLGKQSGATVHSRPGAEIADLMTALKHAKEIQAALNSV